MSYLATGYVGFLALPPAEAAKVQAQAQATTVTDADLAKIPVPKAGVPFWIDPLTGTKYGSGAARAAAYTSGKEKIAREAGNRRMYVMAGVGVGALVLVAILAGRK